MATRNPNIFDKIASFFTGDSESATSVSHDARDIQEPKQEHSIFSNDVGRMFDANGSNADFGVKEDGKVVSHEFGGVSFERDGDNCVARFGDKELDFKTQNLIYSNGPDSGIHYDAYGYLGDDYREMLHTPYEFMEVRNYETGDRFLIHNEVKPLDDEGKRVEITSYRGESIDNMEVSGVTVVNLETGWVDLQTLYVDREGMRETIITDPQDWGCAEYHYDSTAKDEASGREFTVHYDSGGRVEIEGSFLPMRFFSSVEYDGDTKIEKSYINRMSDVLGLYRGSDSNVELQTVTVTEKDGDREIIKEYNGETYELKETTVKYETDGHSYTEVYRDDKLQSRDIDGVTTKYSSIDGVDTQTIVDKNEHTITVYTVDAEGELTLSHEYICNEDDKLVSATHYTDSTITTEKFLSSEITLFKDGDWDSEYKFEHLSEIYNENGELIETRMYDESYYVSDISYSSVGDNPELRTTFEMDGDKQIETRYVRDHYDSDQGRFVYTTEITTINPDGTFESKILGSDDKVETGLVIDGEKYYHTNSDTIDGRKIETFETRHASNDVDYKKVDIAIGDNGEKHIVSKTEVELSRFDGDQIDNFKYGNDVVTTVERYGENGEITEKTVSIERNYDVGTDRVSSEYREHIRETYDSEGRLVNAIDIKEEDGYQIERTDKTITYDTDGSCHIETRIVSDSSITIETTDRHADGSYVEKIERLEDNGDETCRVDSVEERSYDSEGIKQSHLICEYGLSDNDGDRIATIKETVDGVETERKEVVTLEDTTVDNDLSKYDTDLNEAPEDYDYTDYDNDSDYGEPESLAIHELDSIPFENNVEISENNTISFNEKEFSLNTDSGQGTYLKDWECKDGEKEYSLKTITDSDGNEKVLVYTESEARDESVSFAEDKTEVKTTVEYHYDRDGNCDSKTVTYSYNSRYNEYMEQSSDVKEIIKETYSGDTLVERTEEKSTDRFDQDYGTGEARSEYVKVSYEDSKEVRETVTIDSKTSHAGIEDCKISKEIVVTNEDGSSTEVSEQYRFVDGEVVVTERIEVDYSTDGDKVETRVIEYGLPDKDGDCICRETTFDSQGDKTDIKKEIVNEKDIPRFEGDLHEAQDYIDSESENDNKDYTDYDSYDNPDE